MKTRNALYLAGAILVVATLVSMFQKADLIWATLMVISAVLILFFGYQKDKQLVKKCMTNPLTKKKVALVTLSLTTLFFGLGFAVGKLIYLWSL
ncbi:hypothetical protein FGF1_27280 [Flavobacteriaceae bacterium GF1]